MTQRGQFRWNGDAALGAEHVLAGCPDVLAQQVGADSEFVRRAGRDVGVGAEAVQVE
ncbi:hypothetical protein ACWFRM_24510 [Streptomyces sp. NPDC055144]